MSDSEEKKRPNAHYQLSEKENINPDEIIYRYSRERRLDRAPQSVRDLYNVAAPRRFAVFRTLIGTRPRAIMFLSIIVICVMIMILSRIGYFGRTYQLEGNDLSVQAARFGETALVTLIKSERRTPLSRINQAYTGAVAIAVLPARNMEEAEVFYHRVFFTHEPQEHFQFTVPFSAVELMLILQSERKTLNMTVRPE